jgi:hypothetical protein
MYKTAFVLLATVLVVARAFTNPAAVGRGATKCAVPSSVDKTAARQPDVMVAKNALREYANWNDVWDGYGGGMGGGCT